MSAKVFITDDRVAICGTGSPIDGQQGTILGLSVDHVTRIWIVGLDEPYRDERGRFWRAVTMPDACLDRIPGRG